MDSEIARLIKGKLDKILNPDDTTPEPSSHTAQSQIIQKQSRDDNFNQSEQTKSKIAIAQYSTSIENITFAKPDMIDDDILIDTTISDITDEDIVVDKTVSRDQGVIAAIEVDEGEEEVADEPIVEAEPEVVMESVKQTAEQKKTSNFTENDYLLNRNKNLMFIKNMNYDINNGNESGDDYDFDDNILHFRASGLRLDKLKSISIFCEDVKLKIPVFLVDAFNIIRLNIKTEGLFLLRGNVSRLNLMRYTFFGEFGIPEYCTLFDICDLILYFLANIKEPLFTKKYELKFLEYSKTDQLPTVSIMSFCGSLPSSHLDVLIFLLQNLQHILAHSIWNKIEKADLLASFVPAIFRFNKVYGNQCSKLLNFFIENVKFLIEKDNNFNLVGKVKETNQPKTPNLPKFNAPNLNVLATARYYVFQPADQTGGFKPIFPRFPAPRQTPPTNTFPAPIYFLSKTDQSQTSRSFVAPPTSTPLAQSADHVYQRGGPRAALFVSVPPTSVPVLEPVPLSTVTVPAFTDLPNTVTATDSVPSYTADTDTDSPLIIDELENDRTRQVLNSPTDFIIRDVVESVRNRSRDQPKPLSRQNIEQTLIKPRDTAVNQQSRDSTAVSRDDHVTSRLKQKYTNIRKRSSTNPVKGGQSFKCNQCYRWFFNQSSLTNHRRAHKLNLTNQFKSELSLTNQFVVKKLDFKTPPTNENQASEFSTNQNRASEISANQNPADSGHVTPGVSHVTMDEPPFSDSILTTSRAGRVRKPNRFYIDEDDNNVFY